jgi:hypothetical protein
MKIPTSFPNCIDSSLGRSALLFVSLLIGFFVLFPTAHAVCARSDGNYPGGNTAERISALASLTTNSNTPANGNAANGGQSVFAGGRGWTADVKQGEVVVKQGLEKMCIVKTQLPFVEETRFLNWQGKQCLAVKSRARHGPAALELFDAHTGALVDKIMAFAIENDKPAWAARWKE